MPLFCRPSQTSTHLALLLAVLFLPPFLDVDPPRAAPRGSIGVDVNEKTSSSTLAAATSIRSGLTLRASGVPPSAVAAGMSANAKPSALPLDPFASTAADAAAASPDRHARLLLQTAPTTGAVAAAEAGSSSDGSDGSDSYSDSSPSSDCRPSLRRLSAPTSTSNCALSDCMGRSSPPTEPTLRCTRSSLRCPWRGQSRWLLCANPLPGLWG